jgi:hypothetical protein
MTQEEKQEFLLELGPLEVGSSVYNIGLALMPNLDLVSKVTELFQNPDDVLLVTVKPAVELNILDLIIESMHNGRKVVVMVEGDINPDFFTMLNHLSWYSRLKLDSKESIPSKEAALVVCFAEDEYDASAFNYGSIFYPQINVK